MILGMKTIVVPPGKIEVVAQKGEIKVEHNAIIPKRELVKTINEGIAFFV
jgi:hypothetical protein